MLSLCSADFDFQKDFLPGLLSRVFLLVVAILRGRHYEGLGYDNAKDSLLDQPLLKMGSKLGFTPCISLAAMRRSPLCWLSVPINKRTIPTHSSAGNVVRLTQYFSSMCKALSLIPSTARTGLGSVCL